MESMKLDANDYEAVYSDSTAAVEGYGEVLETIRDRYDLPAERESEEDILQKERAEEMFNPQSEANQTLGTEFPTENVEPLTDSNADPYNIEEGSNIFKPETFKPKADLSKFTDREKVGYKLDLPLHAQEDEIKEKLQSANLEETLEAFEIINADPDLLERLDVNGDGKFTMADHLDLSRMNDGQGVTTEQDIELTEKYLSQLKDKSLAARFKAIYGKLPGSLRSVHMLEERQSRLDPRKNAIYSQNFDNNLRAGILESASTTLNIPEAILHHVSGGRLGGGDGQRY